MVPLYILGLLLRYGPQHGYQIKKRIEEELEDFTQIKLPTVYYHLEKLESAGLLTAQRDKQGARPEKTVYQVSKDGEKQFQKLLLEAIHTPYRPQFLQDAAFYFSDHLNGRELDSGLEHQIQVLNRVLELIQQHRKETLKHIPEEMRVPADLIFEHHIQHYQTEIAWAEEARRRMKEAGGYAESQDH